MEKPTIRQCVTNFCLQCKNQDVWAIGNCAKEECPLHPVRPNKVLLGKTPDDYDLDELQQSVLDALHFTGLKEKPYV